MPGPPPPPPPGPPPPPLMSLPKMGGGGGGGPDDRGALLKSIRQGAKLKKTVTVDKSAPLIQGKTNVVSNNNGTSTGSNGGITPSNNSIQSKPNGIVLGGLFAGGMPKLKVTGRLGTISSSTPSLNNNESDKSPSPKLTPSKNFDSIQDQLKKQLHNPSDTRARGPPPPAPTRHISVEERRPAKPASFQTNNSNGVHLSQTSIQGNISSLHNSSALHSRKSKSNANLSSLDCTDNVNNGGLQPSKPVINHGKPNLAPKPPVLNGKLTPPTKLAVKPNNKSISRAQSMRTPRSPSPQSPTPNNDVNLKFGTVRNMSAVIGQSLSNLNSPSPGNGTRSRPPLLGRPSVPPPSVPPPPTPSSGPPAPKPSTVRPPNHAPPPPPGVPQPPSHAPPPPPHKTQQQPQPVRPPPAVPNSSNANPPPPPPRHSSMRDGNNVAPRRTGTDLEEKFRHLFNTPDRFPRPPPYRNILKLYSNRQASNKQQAPPPPPQLHLHPSNKSWNTTSTC